MSALSEIAVHAVAFAPTRNTDPRAAALTVTVHDWARLHVCAPAVISVARMVPSRTHMLVPAPRHHTQFVPAVR